MNPSGRQCASGLSFESFAMLSAMAMVTRRVRLGHMVICTGFRNPALTAKLASTIDVISGGRFELGIGAGWKEDEWKAYGYGFPTIGERMGALGDHLAVITRMLGPGRATYEGQYAHVRGAVNVPKGIQAHIPIIVGGNGERVTAGYAVKYADELNFVYIDPDEIVTRMASVRARCEAEGRDPATLRAAFSYHPDKLSMERTEDSAASSASRPAGRRRPRRRPSSPTSASRPGWRWKPPPP